MEKNLMQVNQMLEMHQMVIMMENLMGDSREDLKIKNFFLFISLNKKKNFTIKS